MLCDKGEIDVERKGDATFGALFVISSTFLCTNYSFETKFVSSEHLVKRL